MTTRCSLWLDGCFDGFHYAHANVVRQALYLVPEVQNPRIVVGVHSDKEIMINKGPPLFDETERYNLIRACRWVDEVILDVPYVTQLDIIERYHIDFVVHGDDTVLDAQGNDCYAAFKEIGKYKECKRSEGISTTSLIRRILRPEEWALTFADDVRLAHLLDLFVGAIPSPFPNAHYAELTSDATRCNKFYTQSSFRKSIYLGGTWDCFGAGHVELMSRAKEVVGDDELFLIIGLWPDEVLTGETGERPLLTLLERALAVIQCKHTDAVIISAPRTLPTSLLRALGIRVVVNADADAPIDSGTEYVRVEEPKLQSVARLRARLSAQLPAYEERQRRKGLIL